MAVCSALFGGTEQCNTARAITAGIISSLISGAVTYLGRHLFKAAGERGEGKLALKMNKWRRQRLLCETIEEQDTAIRRLTRRESPARERAPSNSVSQSAVASSPRLASPRSLRPHSRSRSPRRARSRPRSSAAHCRGPRPRPLPYQNALALATHSPDLGVSLERSGSVVGRRGGIKWPVSATSNDSFTIGGLDRPSESWPTAPDDRGLLSRFRTRVSSIVSQWSMSRRAKVLLADVHLQLSATSKRKSSQCTPQSSAGSGSTKMSLQDSRSLEEGRARPARADSPAAPQDVTCKLIQPRRIHTPPRSREQLTVMLRPSQLFVARAEWVLAADDRAEPRTQRPDKYGQEDPRIGFSVRVPGRSKDSYVFVPAIQVGEVGYGHGELCVTFARALLPEPDQGPPNPRDVPKRLPKGWQIRGGESAAGRVTVAGCDWPVLMPANWVLAVAWVFNGVALIGGALALLVLLCVAAVTDEDATWNVPTTRSFAFSLFFAFVVQDLIKVLAITFLSAAQFPSFLRGPRAKVLRAVLRKSVAILDGLLG